MKSKVNLPRSIFALLISINLFLLACSLLDIVKKKTPENAQPTIPSEEDSQLSPTNTITPQFIATVETQITLSSPTEAYDLSQAGLPPGFPINPGGYGFSGIPGILLVYSIDVDVRTASAYYEKELSGLGWTGNLIGGEGEGSCGGDCGPVPTKTPGPGPTATPEGWMRKNTQTWMSGTSMVIIDYSVNPDGGTEISIMIISK